VNLDLMITSTLSSSITDLNLSGRSRAFELDVLKFFNSVGIFCEIWNLECLPCSGIDISLGKVAMLGLRSCLTADLVS